MNEIIVNSRLIRSDFLYEILPIQFSRKIEEIDRLSIKKVIIFIFLAFKLTCKLSRFHPDAVYFTLSPTGAAFLRDCLYVSVIRAFCIDVIYHLHGKGIRQESQNYVKRKLYQWVFRSTPIILLSPYLLPDVEAFTEPQWINCIPNGIVNGISDTQYRQIAKRRAYKESSAPVTILYLGNMILTKGPIKILEACRVLSKECLNFHALFVGDWFNDSCKTIFTKYVLENRLEEFVTYCGPQYGRAKEEYLKKSDIFVYPSSKDAFPLVILEAMQFGLPVISTFEGAIPEIVDHGITGIILDSQDLDNLVNWIRTFITKKDIRLAYGAAARKKFMNNYTSAHFERNLHRVLTTILNNENCTS